MKKIWKKLAVIVSIVCLTLTCALFAACGDDEPADGTEVTYTVTVVAPDGTTPVQGVQIAFCDPVTEQCKAPVTTNAQGIATFTNKKQNYHVQVNKTPEGYVATGYLRDDKNCYTKDWKDFSYTIVLSEA